MKNKVFLVLFFCAGIAYCANLQTNSGFETGDLTGWGAVGTESSILVSNSQSYKGVYSLRFKDPTSAFSGRGIESSDYIAIPSPDDWAFSIGAYFYLSNDAGGSPSDSEVRIYVKWFDSSYQELGETGYVEGQKLKSFDTWQPLSVSSISAPAGSSYAKVVVDVRENVNNNNDIYVDEVTLDYFPMPAFLKTTGLKTFSTLQGHENEQIKVFFPRSTPDGCSKEVRIVFNLEKAPTTEAKIKLEIYDSMGRLVRTIVRGSLLSSKHYDYIWDGRDNEQRFLPMGMYIIFLEIARLFFRYNYTKRNFRIFLVVKIIYKHNRFLL